MKRLWRLEELAVNNCLHLHVDDEIEIEIEIEVEDGDCCFWLKKKL